MFKDSRIHPGAIIISMVVIVGFFALAGLFVSGMLKSSDQVGGVVGIFIGAIIVLTAVVVQFWLGSSSGSKMKDPQPITSVTRTVGEVSETTTTGAAPTITLQPPNVNVVPQISPTLPPAPVSVPVLKLDKFVGKMSQFGGIHDTGVKATEGLALVELPDLHLFPGVFLDAQPPGTTGLARRLNEDALYCAMRWVYSRTPKSYLQHILVRITNAAGRSIMVRPVDWGPDISTGRIIDLSPGACKQLGISTDDVVTVEVPLPSQDALSAGAPIPTGVHLKAQAQTQPDLERVFGKFTYTEGSGGDINIDQGWISQNIVEVDIPQLHKFTKGKAIQCHRIIAPHLAAAFADIEAKGLLGLVIAYDGLWVPRHKNHDPSRGISLHSWGAAIDINADWNPYGSAPAPLGSKGSTVALIPSFEANGFAWGGYFGGGHGSDTDGMHFEYARTT